MERLKITTGCLIANLLVWMVASCQTSTIYSSITIDTILSIGDNLPDLPCIEPVIAIDPNDSRNLAVATIVVYEPDSENWMRSWELKVLTSKDQGKNWELHDIAKLNDAAISGDPWMNWTIDGRLYLSFLSEDISNGENEGLNIWLTHTDDGGKIWSEPLKVFRKNSGWDHPVLDFTDLEPIIFATGRAFGEITIAKPYSNADRNISFFPDSLNNNLASAVAISDSSSLFTYLRMSGEFPIPLYAVHYDNKSQNFSVHTITDKHVPIGFPMLDIDRNSEMYKGRIYCTWIKSEADYAVHISHSDDTGKTWSSPVVVHEDKSQSLRARPNVTTNQDGVLAVSWVDGRHSDSGICWDVYFTLSKDGGKTFEKEVRLTKETSCPDTDKNGGAGIRWRWGGDYSGITSDSEGNFYVIWSDSQPGVYQIKIARIKYD